MKRGHFRLKGGQVLTVTDHERGLDRKAERTSSKGKKDKRPLEKRRGLNHRGERKILVCAGTHHNRETERPRKHTNGGQQNSEDE